MAAVLHIPSVVFHMFRVVIAALWGSVSFSDQGSCSWTLYAADAPTYSYRGMKIIEEPTVDVDFVVEQSQLKAFRITTAHGERFTHGLEAQQLEAALRDLLEDVSGFRSTDPASQIMA